MANATTLKAASVLKTKLDATMRRFELVWTDIFRGRYRDTSPVVRQLCMKALYKWTQIYPEKFVATEYLKHIGWMLCDPSKEVRRTAFLACKEVFKSSDKALGKVQSSARQGFLGRYATRIFEATNDVDPQITIKALSIFSHFSMKRVF